MRWYWSICVLVLLPVAVTFAVAAAVGGPLSSARVGPRPHAYQLINGTIIANELAKRKQTQQSTNDIGTTGSLNLVTQSLKENVKEPQPVLAGNLSRVDDFWPFLGRSQEPQPSASYLVMERPPEVEYFSGSKNYYTASSVERRNENPTTVLTVGYLTAIKGELKDKQGLAISGAITMAIDEINNNPNILPNVTLALRWNDTRGDTVLATRAITEMICDGVSTFFGPEGNCHVEAIVSQSRNIPMISYKCSDYMASAIPTFARTEPPDTQVTKSIISLLNYYGWKKFSIIHEELWTTVATSLKEQAEVRNMTINHNEKVIDNHKCCENEMECCRAGYWYQVVQNTMNRTRIYVFLGPVYALVNMMEAMDAMKLFHDGQYMVIFVDMMTYSAREAQKYIWKPDHLNKHRNCEEVHNFKQRARSLLVIVSSPPAEKYENFTEQVREYNKREPFNFSTPTFFNVKNYIKFVSIYAAYLYDSVILYAMALDKLLSKQKQPLTEELIREVASNGTLIVETIILNKTYKSVTGATIKIDENGDSEGNFSVLALKEQSFTQENFSCDYHMVPVATFIQGDDIPEYKIINASVKIDWPGGDRPFDEPSCGFLNELCPRDDTHITSMLIAGILAVVLFCAGVIAMSIYRKWKIELEIEGLLWKIECSEIKGYFGNDIVSSPSKLSLASAASFGSRGSNQMFTSTGQFRGVVVRIKELKFSKKKDISRDIMKEMRLLRDLRHDNINSFIGAGVEPMRTLLVTDYCAKGSLYDIIENEDIKLEDIFIASLVHDLIKGMIYIHNSALVFHGNLKSSNCVVTSRWLLQVADFGLHDLRHCAENESIGEHQHYRSLFWKAPELLRNPNIYGTQRGDVYAFAIILYEIISRKGPFGQTGFEPKEIIKRVKHCPDISEEPFRPDLECIGETGNCPDYVRSCIQDSWNELPELRPDFPTIRTRLKKMRGGKSKNIMDQMMEMMEKYTNNLEEIVNERTRLLCEEKKKTEDLLHRMLPQTVAEKLTRGHGVEPVSYDNVTIYFSDIVGFTSMSAESTPLQVVNFLNDLYTVFDRIIKGYDVYKVETIGDAYMVVSGLPIKNHDRHVGEIASMALELLEAVKSHKISHRPNETLKLRIGMHTGPVVAGVVGLTMPRYCLFGDTVNTASRMESNGEALKIHVSPNCKLALDKLGGYITEIRGPIHMKGKGEVVTHWLVGATDMAIQKKPVSLEDLPPPLFCRPRKSPKCESRQPSIIAGSCFGIPNMAAVCNSRRQSQIALQGSVHHSNGSPRAIHRIGSRVERLPLYMNHGSRSTLEEPQDQQIEMGSLERGPRKKHSVSMDGEEIGAGECIIDCDGRCGRNMACDSVLDNEEQRLLVKDDKKPTVIPVADSKRDSGKFENFKSFNKKHASFDTSNLMQLRESRSLDRFPSSDQRKKRLTFRRLASKLTFSNNNNNNNSNSQGGLKRPMQAEPSAIDPHQDNHMNDSDGSINGKTAPNIRSKLSHVVIGLQPSDNSCNSDRCSSSSSNKLLAAIPGDGNHYLDSDGDDGQHHASNELVAVGTYNNNNGDTLVNCNGLNCDPPADQMEDDEPLLEPLPTTQHPIISRQRRSQVPPAAVPLTRLLMDDDSLPDESINKKWRSMSEMHYFEGRNSGTSGDDRSTTGGSGILRSSEHPKGPPKMTNFEEVPFEDRLPNNDQNSLTTWLKGMWPSNSNSVGKRGGSVKPNHVNNNNNNSQSNKNKNNKRFNSNLKLMAPTVGVGPPNANADSGGGVGDSESMISEPVLDRPLNMVMPLPAADTYEHSNLRIDDKGDQELMLDGIDRHHTLEDEDAFGLLKKKLGAHFVANAPKAGYEGESLV